MNVAPVIPLSGYGGWTFLKRTLPAQQATFEKAAPAQRDEAYFRERIGTVKTAEALVADPRLLRVALGAFGLEGDQNNRAFIRKVLEGGTLKAGSLANRLADKQYLALSAAFGFGDFAVPRTQVSTFADGIIAKWKARRFEAAVGERNPDLRLAMNAQRELAALAARPGSDAARWFTIMGNPPLRTVFETAFGLPPSFGALDLDRQLATLRTRAASALGSDSVAQFADAGQVDRLLRRFLSRADTGPATGPAANALQLLRQGRR